MSENNIYYIQCGGCGIKPLNRNSSDWGKIKISGNADEQTINLCPECLKRLKSGKNSKGSIFDLIKKKKS